ncbi:MAG TPA: hypothetical protein PKU97_24500, partial [Kofleriaceae bacterium]|nr:hypothetical protein [Kofleriaceae bacterium]
EQERSSVFTQELGNIPPGEELVAMLELDQKLEWLDDGQWARMCAEHALPPGWEAMTYEEFLVAR